MLQNLTIWIVIGVSAGWLADRLSHANGMGLALNAIIGCMGAAVGALTLSLVMPRQAPLSVFSLYGLLSAFAAAVLFLAIARAAASLSAARSSR